MRIGIAGLGFMGVTHLGALSKIPGVEVAAICSSNPRVLAGDLSQVGGNLKRARVEFDFSRVRTYTDWTELVADPDLDIIDICLPTPLHLPVTTAALDAGKHVLCEKPMAPNAAECAQMLAAAERSGRLLMIAQVLRFWPEYEFLKEFVTSKRYGEIRSATFIRRAGVPDWSRWLPNEELSGGALLDLLVHDIDQILLLFGVPERVAAKSMGGPDTVAATFIYPTNIEVRLQGGWFAAGSPFSMSFQARADRAFLDWTPEGLMLNDEAGKRERVEVGTDDAYEAEIRYFVDCCRAGAQPERCRPQESARAVELTLLLKESRSLGGAQLKCSV